MFLALLGLALCEFSRDQALSFEVKAPWYGAPLFDQIVMFLGDRAPSQVAPFLKACSASPGNTNDQLFVWNELKKLIPIESLKLFKALLDVDYLLPRLEMFRESVRAAAGEDYPDVVVVGQQPSFAHPGPFIDRRMGPTFTFDVKFGEPKTLVYANMHNQEALEFVISLIEQKVDFYLRPTGRGDRIVNLKGFGVEMRPYDKEDTEYPPRGDEKIERLERHLRFKDGYLEWFGDELPSDDPVAMQFVDQIGERFATLLKQYSKVNMTEFMRDVTNNWPIFKQILSTTEPTHESRDEIQEARELLANVKQGMSVNGREVSVATDIFSLLEIIQEEQTVRDMFRVLGVESEEIFQTQLSDDPSILLDFQGENVYWLNDLEKDPQYASWSTSLSELQRPAQGIPRVKKNLVNLVMYLDPSTPAGLFQLYTGFAMAQQGMPIRVGFVPYFNLGNRLSRKVAFAFHHVALMSQKEAVSFLVTAFALCGLNRKTQQMNNLTEKHFSDAYSRVRIKIIDWKDLYKSYHPGSIEYFRIATAHQYFKMCGVPLNTMTLNGKVLAVSSGLQGVAAQMQHTLKTIEKLCVENGYTDVASVDLMGLLAKKSLIVSAIDMSIIKAGLKGTGIPRMSPAKQKEFIDLFDRIEWCHTDESSDFLSFYIYFGPENEVFNKFMNGKHAFPSVFAKNPEALRTFFGIGENDTALITNGRVYYGLQLENQTQLWLIDLWSRDFVLKHVNMFGEQLPTLAAKAYMSILLVEWYERGITRTSVPLALWQHDNALIYSSQRVGLMPITLVLDPFTTAFQRLIDFIHYFDKNRLFDINIALVIPDVVNDIDGTLDCFYRCQMNGYSLIFNRLNDDVVYSAQMVTPRSWILERVQEMVNIERIDLGLAGSGLQSCELLLSGLLVEGTCVARGGTGALGVEVGVVDLYGNHYGQSVVTATTGYFQIPARPGVFQLELTANVSKEHYRMVDYSFSVFTFGRREYFASVIRKDVGKPIELEDLTVEQPPHVDVFSIASGPLDERLLRSMMLSVKRNTQVPVKFWLLKTWLSPKFKAMLPVMAAQYGFDYEFVDYHWPAWVRKPLQRRELIARTKLMFLDLIFPLSLNRVIVVDPSQIITGDLNDLMDLEFGGAPYAFPPICESRAETEQARYWRQGVWKELLKDKTYHSASLFAVNLARFRTLNTGEWIRIVSQQFSPQAFVYESVDRDLPNFMQDRVPIYTLAQNWFWSSKWCTSETMSSAKAIAFAAHGNVSKVEDAMANPKWVELDTELQELPEPSLKKYYEESLK